MSQPVIAWAPVQSRCQCYKKCPSYEATFLKWRGAQWSCCFFWLCGLSSHWAMKQSGKAKPFIKSKWMTNKFIFSKRQERNEITKCPPGEYKQCLQLSQVYLWPRCKWCCSLMQNWAKTVWQRSFLSMDRIRRDINIIISFFKTSSNLQW